MGEIEAQYLKIKCNRLIDRALSLEKELQEKELQLSRLRETKRELERELAENGIADAEPQPGAPEAVREEYVRSRGKEIPEQKEPERQTQKAVEEENRQDKKLSGQKLFEMLQNLSTHIQTQDIVRRPKRHTKTPLYKEFRRKREHMAQEEADREEIGAEEEVVIIYEKSGIGEKLGRILMTAALFAVIGAAVCAAVICLM